MAKGAIDLFLIYQFLKRLVTPFEKWDAYETGVIDKDGKVIVSKKDRTQEQDKSWGYYDRLIANLKKLLAKVPGGRSRLASFAAALLLIREQNLDPDNLEMLSEKLEMYMDEAKLLSEEVATNTVGGGKIAGVGVGPDGEPGFTPNVIRRHKKRMKKKAKEVSRKVSAMMGEAVEGRNTETTKERIKRERERDRVKFDRLLDRARLDDAKLKNRQTRPGR